MLQKKNIKKIVLTLSASALMVFSAGTALAETVYYKETAVEWDYGRTAGVFGYSNIQSSYYTHAATVNGAFSGWKKKGVLASAKKYVGTNKVEVYWSCK